MRNALLLSSASILFATNLFANAGNVPVAQTAPVAAPCMGCGCPDARVNIGSGFYAGMQGGYHLLRTNYKGTFTDRILNPGDYVRSASDSKGGIAGEVVLGARMVRQNCMVAGLEVSYLLNSGENNKQVGFGPNNGLLLRFKTKREFGATASGVFGWLINSRMMVYGKVGLAVSRLEDTLVDDLAVVPRTTKTDKTSYGVVPAIGMEYGLSPRWSIRGEVSAEIYKRHGHSYLIGDVTPVNNANVQNSLVLRTNSNMINSKIGLFVKI